MPHPPLKPPADPTRAGGVQLPYERPLYDLLTSLYQRLLALAGLIALSPLLLLIALLVKLSSRGPILYRGERVAKAKGRFTIYKFRTMKVGAEQEIGKRLVQPGEQRHYTSIGPSLRRYRLDELPQLLNVLKGEMALVGPRPLRPIFLDELCETIPRYERRFDVRPGITGLAQVRGGYYTSPRHKLAYDLLYIKRRSLPLDLRLIALTFLRVMTRVISVSLALSWLLLASFALPESQLSALTIQPKELSINLLYLVLPSLIALKALGSTASRKRLSLLRSPVDGVALALTLSMLVSATLSVTPLLALRGALWYLCNALIPFYLCLNSAPMKADPQASLKSLSRLGGLISLIALSGSLARWPTEGWLRPGGGLDDPLWLSLGLMCLLPLSWVASSGSDEPRGWRARLKLGSFALISLTLVLAGSRLALLSAALVGSFSAGLRRAALIGLAFVSLSFMMVASEDPRWSVGQLKRELSGHVARQEALLDLVPTQRLILGVGPRVSAHYLAARYKQRQESELSQGLEELAPHEEPHLSGLILTSLIEFGLIGGLLLGALILGSLRLIIREARLQSSRVLSALSASLSSALLIGLVCHPFAIFPLSLLFWSLLGFGVGVALEGRSGPRRVYQLIRASAPL